VKKKEYDVDKARVVETFRRKKEEYVQQEFMTNKLRVLRRNPSGGGCLYISY
jgi:hypothetical protein